MPDRISPPLERREFTLREVNVDEENGIVRGIAVPFDQPTRIREWFEEYDEQFARGSVDDDGALAFWRHDDPIGVLTEAEDVTAGRRVALRISQTTLGRDVLTLARDLQAAGRPLQMSVGFEPGGDHTVEERDNDVPLVTRTRARVREVSLVPFGAYGDGASVTEVRERQNQERTMNQPAPPAPADENLVTREEFEEHQRSVATLLQSRPSEPAYDRRSAAAFLRDLVSGDAATIEAYNRSQQFRHDELQHRAYTGGTTADAPVRDAWAGDLTRIFDASSGVLADTFGTGTLPATGLNLEFARLLENTVDVAEQAAEGDDLGYGQVKLENDTEPIKTYGGLTQLTRQQIERSTLPVLQRSLEALAVAAAARKKAVLRAKFDAVVSARTAIASNGGVVVLGAVLGSATASQWEDALVEAALRFEALNASIERMLVSASVFKKLRSLTVSGERVFRVAENNASGTLDLPGLRGSFASVDVRLDAGQTGDKAQFVHGRALRAYDSALVSLQDENIVNLSKDFGVYRYGAVADEEPQLILPVKLAAS